MWAFHESGTKYCCCTERRLARIDLKLPSGPTLSRLLHVSVPPGSVLSTLPRVGKNHIPRIKRFCMMYTRSEKDPAVYRTNFYVALPDGKARCSTEDATMETAAPASTHPRTHREVHITRALSACVFPATLSSSCPVEVFSSLVTA